MVSKLFQFMQEHGHSMAVGFGALGAAAAAGYWANQNEKKVAVLAADVRAERAENERKIAVSAAENDRKFAVSAAENDRKFAVSAADARTDKAENERKIAENRALILQQLIELGNAAEYKNYMFALGEQKLNSKRPSLPQEQ
eukprot:CAMPEP_0181322034 /NCGR_PEP_ID=MMETSP1101-20121128/19014_1 /TAXON_ID=46948 /ORGANISM="Rhodomonas abbreviata, Strain Caron Lab Isolate" /LENGTH=141 /DNA_ID=CAMNT_0023429923 /DNA_START=91 /DNA_END=516 /DNA_ORIENTATION=+